MIEKIAEIEVNRYDVGKGLNIDLYLKKEGGKKDERIHLGHLYLTKDSHIVKRAAEGEFEKARFQLIGYITGEVNETDFIEIFNKAKITKGKLSESLKNAIYKTIKWRKEEGDEPLLVLPR